MANHVVAFNTSGSGNLFALRKRLYSKPLVYIGCHPSVLSIVLWHTSTSSKENMPSCLPGIADFRSDRSVRRGTHFLLAMWSLANRLSPYRLTDFSPFDLQVNSSTFWQLLLGSPSQKVSCVVVSPSKSYQWAMLLVRGFRKMDGAVQMPLSAILGNPYHVIKPAWLYFCVFKLETRWRQSTNCYVCLDLKDSYQKIYFFTAKSIELAAKACQYAFIIRKSLLTHKEELKKLLSNKNSAEMY